MRAVAHDRRLYGWLPLLLSAAVVAGAAALGLVQSGSPLSVAQVVAATATVPIGPLQRRLGRFQLEPRSAKPVVGHGGTGVCDG